MNEKIRDIDQEYSRIKALFSDVDEKQLALIDGAFWECARLRIELDRLNEILKDTGPVICNPKNKGQQKVVPAANMTVKIRANYLNYLAKLSNILGKNVEDEDDDLEDFE